MMFGQYCRIESRAGGVACTEREFIRAALSMIKKNARFGPIACEYRTGRHMWLRQGLEMRLKARDEYRHVTGSMT